MLKYILTSFILCCCLIEPLNNCSLRVYLNYHYTKLPISIDLSNFPEEFELEARMAIEFWQNRIGFKVIQKSEGKGTIVSVGLIEKNNPYCKNFSGRTNVLYRRKTREILSGKIEVCSEDERMEIYKTLKHEIGHLFFVEQHNYCDVGLMTETGENNNLSKHENEFVENVIKRHMIKYGSYK